MSCRRTADIVIIGGGIIGLSIGDALLADDPTLSIILLEKEDQVGKHASGRNSGVIHAGFYYTPDSLKARLTRDGNRLLQEFCAESSIPVRGIGKVVVTTAYAALPALLALYSRANANGVEVHLVDPKELASLEPMARTKGYALWSPTTASADPQAVTLALADRFVTRGGQVEIGNPALGAATGVVVTKSGAISCWHVVNCAGLYADRVAGWFGMADGYRMLPFRGNYWVASPGAVPIRRHIYPVPDANLPFLGTHFTVTADGHIKVGPTATPLFSREMYGDTGSFRFAEFDEIARTLPRMMRGQHTSFAHLLRSEIPKMSRRALLANARKMVPDLDPKLFKLRGRSGIRAQLFDLTKNELEMDFVVRGDGGSTHLLNAVSPGWTTSLAMAKHVVADISQRTR